MIARIRAAIAARRAARDTIASIDPEHEQRIVDMYARLAQSRGMR